MPVKGLTFWEPESLEMMMAQLPSPKATRKIRKDEYTGANLSSAQDGPQPCSSPLTVQTYCDASFAPGGGRSRSGILVLLVDEVTNRASLLLWQSRRQTLTALSAPEAELVALSEALMAAVVIHESCCDIGLEVGQSPKILFVVKQRVSHHTFSPVCKQVQLCS